MKIDRYDCHKKSSQNPSTSGKWPDVFGRMEWDKPSPTITGGCVSFTKGRYGHPDENRTITPREVARIQSFPDDFVFYGPKKSICQQLGNAVPPLLAQWLGESLIAMLSITTLQRSIPKTGLQKLKNDIIKVSLVTKPKIKYVVYQSEE